MIMQARVDQQIIEFSTLIIMILGTAFLYEKMSQFIEQKWYVLLLIYDM